LQRVRAVGRKAFDRGDPPSRRRRRRERARTHRLAVDVHGARAAGGDAAAELGAGKAELLAQHPEQRRIVVGVDPVRLPVDRQFDHATPSPWRESGMERRRLPLAAWMALASAGGTVTGLTSPMPPSLPPPWMNSVTSSGVSAS